MVQCMGIYFQGRNASVVGVGNTNAFPGYHRQNPISETVEMLRIRVNTTYYHLFLTQGESFHREKDSQKWSRLKHWICYFSRGSKANWALRDRIHSSVPKPHLHDVVSKNEARKHNSGSWDVHFFINLVYREAEHSPTEISLICPTRNLVKAIKRSSKPEGPLLPNATF